MSSYPPEAVRLEPGLHLDRYELLCVLAHGGMGSVWLARLEGKHGFERLVALKTVLPQHSLEDRYRRMFLDEARLASRIAHPNIAQTLDLGESHGVLYFVMEWVDGDAIRKLRSVVTKANAEFPISIALRICADACAGLHAAHELTGDDGQLLNVVHRDVSPQNILLSVTGVTKVIDFGIAKARERLAEETHADELKGKVDYMAPEQAVGPAVDRRTDVYALGAVLYHLCGGVPPYDAETKVAGLMQRIRGKPPAPLPDFVPRPVKDVVSRALARDMPDRFATAGEMQRALEEAMSACGEIATAAEVAEFVRVHLAESIEVRKIAVQAALDAANERQRKKAQLEEPLEDHRSGTDTDNARISIKARISAGMALDSHKPVVLERMAALASEPPPAEQTAGTTDEIAQRVVPTRGRAHVVAFIASAALLLTMLALAVRARIVRARERGDTASSAVAAPAPPRSEMPADVLPAPPSVVAQSASVTHIELDSPPSSTRPPPPKAAAPLRPAAKTPQQTPQQTAPKRPPKHDIPKNKVPDDGF